MELFDLGNNEFPSHVLIPGVSTENKSKSENKNFRYIFRVYLSFGYYLCLFPFRLIKSEESKNPTNYYRLRHCTVQKAICGLFHVFILLFAIAKWRVYEMGTLVDLKIFDYLALGLAVSETTYILIFIWILWTQQSTFSYIGRHYPVMRNHENVYYSKTRRILQFVLNWNILTTFLILTFILLAAKLYLGEYLNEPIWFGEKGYLTNTAKFYFFIPKETSLNTPILNIISTVYAFVGAIYSIFLHLLDLFYLVVALMLRDIGTSFVSALSTDSNLSAEKVLKKYDDVKQFVNNLNDGIGPLMLAIVLAALPYYLIRIPIVMHGTDWLERLVVLIYLINFTSFLLLVSSFTVQMKQIRTWLYENESSASIPNHKLKLLILELQDEPLGLNVCGFFQISHNFIAALIQLMVTYCFVALRKIEKKEAKLHAAEHDHN